jgi:hypothetical protein
VLTVCWPGRVGADRVLAEPCVGGGACVLTECWGAPLSDRVLLATAVLLQCRPPSCCCASRVPWAVRVLPLPPCCSSAAPVPSAARRTAGAAVLLECFPSVIGCPSAAAVLPVLSEVLLC